MAIFTSLPSTCFSLRPSFIFIMHCIRLIGNHYVTNWTMATDLRLRIQISLLDHSPSGDLALPWSAESDQKLGGLKKTRKGLLESHASPALVIGARPKIVLSRERHILRPQYILNSCRSFYIAAVLNSYSGAKIYSQYNGLNIYSTCDILLIVFSCPGQLNRWHYHWVTFWFQQPLATPSNP